MGLLREGNRLVALALFVFAFSVYAYTASPTINFWDCGEFVTTAYTMGIPHQPGTPLYVLVGRVFSLLPLGLGIAHKINLMSGFFGALAVAFLYATGVRLIRNWQDELSDPSPIGLAWVAAAVGAMFLAFSETFWINAIEAEVYAIAAFILSFTSYLAVRWYEVRNHDSSATLMLLIVYLMGLSVGFHLGSLAVYPGVFVLVLLARDKALRTLDVLIVSLFMGAFVLSAMTKSDGVVVLLMALAVGAALWRMLTWGRHDESEKGAYFALAGIALFALGLSVHLMMMIRAGQDPAINQSDPETFDRLMHVLRREQYPPRNIFHREAPLLWQLKHLAGTAIWGPGQAIAGQRVIGYIQQFTFFPNPGFLDRFVPLGLWLYGLYVQWRGNRRLFAAFFTMLLVNSLGLMLLLNFNDHEVRDRDYFYSGFYQFAALFLALGTAGLLRAVWSELRTWSFIKPVLIAASALLLFIPAMPVVLADVGGPYGHPKFYRHDRSRNTIAREYGRNILAGLPLHAILFTNGDNDTFPLWYLQEVEGYRTDVRVVNLSLINLPWYIKQLRDYEPKVPIAWNDAQIDGEQDIEFLQRRTRLYAQQLPDGTVYWIRDMAVWHIAVTNGFDPERQLYFAITIPNENIELFLPFLRMEGLVYRMTRDKSEDGEPYVDTEAIWKNFNQVYTFDSILDESGKADMSIYRNDNETHLLRNYPAALCRVGYLETLDENYEFALKALDRAFDIDPTFPLVGELLPIVNLQAGHTQAGLDAARRFGDILPDAGDVYVRTGEGLLQLGELDEALAWAREVYEKDPDDPRYLELMTSTLVARNELDEAERILREWADRTQLPRAYDELRRFREFRNTERNKPPETEMPTMPADPDTEAQR
jgi:tetratricopeptide (TPR) repeat protein